jgi:hypothetical protein
MERVSVWKKMRGFGHCAYVGQVRATWTASAVWEWVDTVLEKRCTDVQWCAITRTWRVDVDSEEEGEYERY